MAYADAWKYGESLIVKNDIDNAVKGYLQGKKGWKEVTEVVATGTRSTTTKCPRVKKRPWMQNRRENRNARKARIYQFT